MNRKELRLALASSVLFVSSVVYSQDIVYGLEMGYCAAKSPLPQVEYPAVTMTITGAPNTQALKYVACPPQTSRLPTVNPNVLGDLDFDRAMTNYYLRIAYLRIGDVNTELLKTNSGTDKLNTTLGVDMRNLLNQFCKTYATKPAVCDELLVPKK